MRAYSFAPIWFYVKKSQFCAKCVKFQIFENGGIKIFLKKKKKNFLEKENILFFNFVYLSMSTHGVCTLFFTFNVDNTVTYLVVR